MMSREWWQIIVETAIHSVSCLNRTVLGVVEQKSISIIYRVGINGTREWVFNSHSRVLELR
ncbi:hypothetical protein [Nostoc punctiforme]|uniref:hypothetical protein n=1 Tax=Nostoc punctiforme TaxID=272131 RepID=UPI000045BE28|nr:hypothetical protein [Nostoc punctiforme]